MNLQLIQGIFNSQEAIDLITQLVQTKIKYHENMIKNHSNEEDIKSREAKIKQLQNELFEIRKKYNSKTENVKVEAIINID